MKIGIGLPNPVPGVPGTRLVEWAQATVDEARRAWQQLVDERTAAGAAESGRSHERVRAAELTVDVDVDMDLVERNGAAMGAVGGLARERGEDEEVVDLVPGDGLASG